MKTKSLRFSIVKALAAGLLAGLSCVPMAGAATANTIIVSNSNPSTSTTNVTDFVTSFGGSAGAVLGFAAGGPVIVADTGVLPTTGGALETATLEQTLNFSGSTPVETAHATTIGQGNIMA